MKRTRALHRKARHKVPFPVVALVGYTNAGKSTLFNRLTGAEVLAKDMLFATLDPTMRGIVLPGGRKVILSDTVGFISDLPTQLVAAFRATLEEVIEADLILHVRDIAHPDSDAQCEDVLRVLEEIGVSEGARERMIEVRNKIDLLPGDDRAAFLARNGAGTKGRPARIYASAVTGRGSTPSRPSSRRASPRRGAHDAKDRTRRRGRARLGLCARVGAGAQAGEERCDHA